MFHPAVAHLPNEDVVAFWTKTNDEDRSICERQQIGMASGVFSPVRYDESEDGLRAFDRLITESYTESYS